MSTAPKLRPLTEQSAIALRAVQANGCLTSIDLREARPDAFVRWSTVLSSLNRTGHLQCRPRTDLRLPIVYTLTDRGRAWLASDAANSVRANRNTLGEAQAPAPAPFVPRLAPPLTYRPTGTYSPARDGGHTVLRPGAQDALRLPSRRMDGLHWRDGRFREEGGMSGTKPANAEQDRALLAGMLALQSAIARLVDAHLQGDSAQLNARLATGALMVCLANIVERHPEIAPDTAVLARWYADDFDAMAAEFEALTEDPAPQAAP